MMTESSTNEATERTRIERVPAERAPTDGAATQREMVSELALLERWFLEAMTTGTRPEQGAHAASSCVPIGTLETILTPGPQLTALERLATYHYAYRARLVECLADDYPALRHALGAESFEAVCNDYIDAHPPRSFSLNAFGGWMPAFCRARAEAWSAFGAELARLEWAIVEVIHAPIGAELSHQRLASVPADGWNDVRLVPNPALRVLQFEYPVNAFYRGFREGQTSALPERAASAVAVHRRDRTLWRTDLASPMAAVLTRLVAGEPLGCALEAADASSEEVSSWFARWVREGFFSDLIV